MPSEPAQVPSDPKETSASRAFQQLSKEQQDRIVAEQARQKRANWVPDDLAEDDTRKDLFAAYNLRNEAEGIRDEAADQYKFEVVQGFFKQSDDQYPRLTTEEMLNANFGLIDNSSQGWADLQTKIKELNASAEKDTTYKLLFCGRHGQGWHNWVTRNYDPVSWEVKWCRLNGDGKYVWGPDPELTELGEQQALAVQEGWKSALAAGGPRPEKWLCSPLTRTADTMRLSFGDIISDETPVFKEGLREIFGQHTCDKRRSKSYLEERFSDYAFEEGFAEEDLLWKPDEREAEVDRRDRLRNTMFDIFANQPETYISITSHGCALRSLLAVLHHTPLSLNTGEMIPIVVKATKQH